jgi:hypothetical protein
MKRKRRSQYKTIPYEPLEEFELKTPTWFQCSHCSSHDRPLHSCVMCVMLHPEKVYNSAYCDNCVVEKSKAEVWVTRNCRLRGVVCWKCGEGLEIPQGPSLPSVSLENDRRYGSYGWPWTWAGRLEQYIKHIEQYRVEKTRKSIMAFLLAHRNAPANSPLRLINRDIVNIIIDMVWADRYINA